MERRKLLRALLFKYNFKGSMKTRATFTRNPRDWSCLGLGVTKSAPESAMKRWDTLQAKNPGKT